jgi:hypothetical protein
LSASDDDPEKNDDVEADDDVKTTGRSSAASSGFRRRLRIRPYIVPA